MGPPQRWLPEPHEDVVTEILLRFPPDEPAHLFRAAVVCKLWLHVVSDPAFLRRYGAFHRGAPLLGFFYNTYALRLFPGFVPTTAAPSPPQPRGHGSWARWALDCCHSRVLLRDIGGGNFVVWDPFSNHWDELLQPWEEMQAPDNRNELHRCHSNSVVLCAVAGCDHNSCRGGPFHVVCVGVYYCDYKVVLAHVYSSESRTWCTRASAKLDGINYFDNERAAVLGNGIYFTVNYGARIVMYDLVEQHLSTISMPPYQYRKVPVLMQNEDGSLGIAGVIGSRLHLWSTMVNAEGVRRWIQRRAIRLEEIMPI